MIELGCVLIRFYLYKEEVGLDVVGSYGLMFFVLDIIFLLDFDVIGIFFYFICGVFYCFLLIRIIYGFKFINFLFYSLCF